MGIGPEDRDELNNADRKSLCDVSPSSGPKFRMCLAVGTFNSRNGLDFMATATDSAAGVQSVSLDSIRINGGTQCRVMLNEDTVKEYADLLVGEFAFPPAVVFFDGSVYWMADGFHRYFAYKRTHHQEMPCDVREGTCEDAQWYAYGANRCHGLRRSNEDKANAVKLALKHPRGAEMSDSAIAAHVGVHGVTVAKYRTELESTSEIQKSDSRTGKDGRKRKTSSDKRSAAAKKGLTEKPQRASAPPQQDDEMESACEISKLDDAESEETREELEAAVDSDSDYDSESEQQETPEESQPVEIRDGLKRVVPEQFAETFSDIAKFEALRLKLNDLKGEFQSLCGSKGGIFLHAQTVFADIENLKQALKFAKPYTVCPYCKGNGCKACRQQGWVPQDVYRSAPGEMKK